MSWGSKIAAMFRYLGFLGRPDEDGRGEDGRLRPPVLIRPDAAVGSDWAPTHRHRKGGLYRVLGQGVLEADRSAVVLYDDAQGTIWVRDAVEFEDGRFVPLEGG